MGTMESDETASPLVAEALEKYAGSVGVRLVGFKDFPARMRSDLSSLNQAGYVRVAGFPSLILDLNFASFEEYAIKQLSRATRKNLRRKFRAADAVSPAISFSFASAYVAPDWFRMLTHAPTSSTPEFASFPSWKTRL